MKIPKYLAEMQWFWHSMRLHWPTTSYSARKFSKNGKSWSRQDRTIHLDNSLWSIWVQYFQFQRDELPWTFDFLFIFSTRQSLKLAGSICRILHVIFQDCISLGFLWLKNFGHEQRAKVTIWTSFMGSLLIIWACFRKWTPGQGL